MNESSLIDKKLESEVTHWRRAIHANPEMAFQETDTASLVAQKLSEFGYQVETGIAKTGVIGTLRFGSGRTIALRADMDALPIQEDNDLPYGSKNPGCMHACGHDGHTAIMLGVAKVLAGRRDLSGTLHIIFQPAEENEGGARAMLDAGLKQNYDIDAIYALHNFPGLPIGKMMVRAGPMLASFDKFDITVEGQGGHGAFPQNCQDTILVASQLVVALNTIVSRNISPNEAAVLSIGSFNTEGTYNVIPDKVHIKGSCRALSEDVRLKLKRRVLEICHGQAQSHDMKITCDYQDGYPVLVNHEVPTQTAIAALGSVVGADNVNTDFEPIMGSEDFAFFLREIPGCYFALGNGDSSPIHTSTYNFNDEASKFGVAAFVRIAELELG